MNPVPQLRTVHARPPAGDTSNPKPAGGSRPPSPPGVDLARVPPPARGLLTHLYSHGLLSDADLARFLAQAGDRVGSLTTRERAGDALVHFGFLSKYVRGRALAGHLSGLILGPYRVLDRAGAGTVGTVFAGEHAVLRRRVALKVLSGEAANDADARERFLAEARTLAAVSHPHLIAAHDAGVTSDGGEEFWYLALEWAAGGDLEQAVYDRGPVGVADGCRWGWQAAAGLDALHRAGYVHRDVKPSNLLVDAAGRLKVADLGLVRHPAADITPVDAVLGSIQFISPEQLSDPTTAGPPADVYGLGVSLFWILSGRLPHPHGSPAEVAQAVFTKDADRLKSVLPNAPAELDDLFARMLARNPAARPPLPAVMGVLARFAAPTGVPDVAGRVLPEAGAGEADSLRAAVGQLEQELTEARKHRDDARRAILKALHAATAVTSAGGYDRGERVGTYAAVLARHLGDQPKWSGYRQPAARVELSAVAAVVDLARTSPDDRKHPDRAAAVFDRLAELPTPLPFLRAARDAARHHHERWDGTGFPAGLKGAAIPPVARIVAVADAFETATADPSADPLRVIDRLAKQAGTAFDPEVIAALESAAEELSALVLPVLDLVPDER